MKTRHPRSPWLRLSLLPVILFASCTREEGPAQVPKPLEPGSKEVLAYVAVPSLDKVLKDVSALADLFAPGKTNPEMLKGQLGAMIGDPQLAHLETGKPIVLVVLKAAEAGAPPAVAAIIPAKEGAAYDQALAQMGIQARSSGSLLLAAQTPEALGGLEKVKGLYQEIAGARLRKTGRLYLQIAGLMEAYRPLLESQLDNVLKMMTAAATMAGAGAETAPASPAAVATLLKLEVKGLLAFLEQCQAAQVDVDLGGRKIGFDQVATFKPGTAVGDFVTRSSARPSPSTTFLEGGGLMSAAFSCDAKGFALLSKQVLEAASREPEGASLKPVMESVLEMGEWWGGKAEFAMSAGKEGGFAMDYAMEVLDEEKYLSAMGKALALFSPGNAFGDLYRGMGLELSSKLEKAARQHAGVPVHRWKMSLSAKDGTPPPGVDMKMMKAFVKDMEVAFQKGQALLSSEPSRLDALIDRVRSSSPAALKLEAQKASGAGRQGYLDYDVVKLLKLMMSVSAVPGKEAMEKSLAGVTSTEPLVFAVTFGEGRAQLQMEIPLAGFAQMVPRER